MTTGGCRATVVYEAHEAMDFGTSCAPTGRRRYLRLTGRTHHIPMSAATMTGAVPMAHGCTVTSAVHRALCANRAMFRSKVLGRAGRRHGYQRRSCDGRAQPRAVWATPRSAERAPASDGADDREKRQSDLSFPSVFVTAVNATSRLQYTTHKECFSARSPVRATPPARTCT